MYGDGRERAALVDQQGIVIERCIGCLDEERTESPDRVVVGQFEPKVAVDAEKVHPVEDAGLDSEGQALEGLGPCRSREEGLVEINPARTSEPEGRKYAQDAGIFGDDGRNARDERLEAWQGRGACLAGDPQNGHL